MIGFDTLRYPVPVRYRTGAQPAPVL